MTYKTVMGHLDTSAGAHTRLALALKLARKFDAHLDGVFATFDPRPVGFYAMAGATDYYEAHRKFLSEKRTVVERMFHSEQSRAQVQGAWAAPEGYPVTAVMQRARTADLVILGPSRPKDPESYVADNFLETVLMGACGPVLLVPETCRFESAGERVLIGWNGSRESARAMRDAVPFIARAAIHGRGRLHAAHAGAGRVVLRRRCGYAQPTRCDSRERLPLREPHGGCIDRRRAAQICGRRGI